MDFDRYTLAVTSPEDWNSIHNALIVDSNEDGIPDRKVTCADSKEHSPTRGTYELTEEEANEIAKHPKVKWIELSPIHHPDSYPEPRPTTKRFKKNVKVYRNLGSAFSYGSTSAEENRTNWAVKRVGFHTNGDCWPGITGEPSPISSDISYSLTGKNVDVVIQDSGVLQYHPEFLDDDGKSRVLDIVLDGPYHIDPSYFTSNSYTYTKPDGRVGITTASAHAWWENSSNRSGAFSSVGTVAIPSNYTVANAIGIGGTSHTMTSSHGTACAGNAAGKNFGLAFESNIWNMSMVSTPTSMGSEASYDLIKIFHQNKPINTATGRKNPTVVNGSWGYYGAFNKSTNVSYKWRGNTGTFTGFSGSSTGVQAYAEGLRGSPTYDATFSTSSRSHSIDVAGAEMVEAGVIFVVAAGNENQRLGVGSNDVQKNDYFTSLISGNDHRGTSLFPSGTLPMGSRDYLHPQGVGFSTVTDSHPVICVGAMDNYINESFEDFEWLTGAEQAASYSNNGPGIDVWAPADEVLSAGARAANGDALPNEVNYARYNSDFVDRYFNGTSSASPVVAGLIALFLETNPSATSDDVKNFIKNDASVGVSTYLYYEGEDNINDDYYWMLSSNMRGAERRILYNPYANDIIPSISGVEISGVSFQQT